MTRVGSGKYSFIPPKREKKKVRKRERERELSYTGVPFIHPTYILDFL
jgi:hypothetical protein